MSEWDIVVIGSGAAGMAAAVAASRGAAEVIIVEAEDQIGGSTRLSGGVINAAGTSLQEALGITDSPCAYFHDYMSANQWRLHPGLIRTFCEGAAPTFEWLIELGVEFPVRLTDDPYRKAGLWRTGIEETPRGHVPDGNGEGLLHALDHARKSQSVEIVMATRVERLLSKQGRISGVHADGVDVDANAVIVASGGFAQNTELLSEHFPESLRSADGFFSTAAAGSRGDLFGFARDVEADTAGPGGGLQLVTPYFQKHHSTTAGAPPASRIYVNAAGRRFIDEDIAYVAATDIFREQGICWAIFDETARRSLDPTFADWTPDQIRHEALGGRIQQATSIGELALKINVPAGVLCEEVERWNEHALAGEDPDFLRRQTAASHAPSDEFPGRIFEPPFYAVRMAPGELILTNKGLRIDPRARVLDSHQRAIPGLFAAGEAGGGVVGYRYIGSGNSIGNALTMGRIAGQEALRYCELRMAGGDRRSTDPPLVS